MKRLALAVALVASALPSSADLLFDNGPLLTGTLGGSNVSRADSTGTAAGGAINSTAGFLADNASDASGGPSHVADDFTIGAGFTWTINSLKFYSYQTGSGNTSTITGLFVKIYNTTPTHPSNAGVFGDFTTNRMSSTSFTNIYRIFNAAGTLDTTRPIMEVTANLGSPLVLGAGTYTMAWAFTGSIVSGPWQPMVSPSPGTANALYSQDSVSSGNFAPMQSSITNNGVATGSFLKYDLPFKVEGTAVPEPGSMIALAVGAAGLLARRRRKN
ncbi:MAG: PEP-CTERM sorting domain-containing protein [Fimbriimonadaceae bacterium]|nr:PEP-CTERM sorting domain-containing protein [Fimbriimonadaceae bacterium]